MKKLSKLVSLMLAVVLCVGMAAPALAVEYDISLGDVTVTESGSWQKGHETYTESNMSTDKTITITGKKDEATTNTITVGENVKDTTITLENVNIDVSESGDWQNAGEAALSIGKDSNVKVELEGENALKSGYNRAGLELNDGASVTVESDDKGSLDTTGGEGGAGIGGGYNGTAGNITITGNANVTATGGEGCAAGIGSGDGGAYENTAGNIEISGSAKVNATGSVGIGSSGIAGNITIKDDAVVEAYSNRGGAGIGSGEYGKLVDTGSDDPNKAGMITIEGNANVTATGGNVSPGIGAGYRGEVHTITIGGNAKVNATGGEGGAGIGSGEEGTVSNIIINGNAQVNAKGVNGGAGIGTSGTGSSTRVDSITIMGSAQVNAVGGDGTAQAIGNGSGGTVGVVRVFQNDGSLYYQNEDSAYTFTPPEGDEITIGEDGTISLPAGTTSVDKDGKTQVLCTNAVIDENGKPASDEHAYDVTSTATCTNDGVATYTCSKCNHSYTVTAEKLDHTPGEAAPENVIEAQPGVEGSYDLVVRCTVCGEIINSEHVTTSALPVPAIPDDGADAADAAPAAETIADQEVPLAGLVSRQILVSALYVHEGSPDGEDAEGEYVKALAWAVANGIVDQDTDPEEVVTVAILRDVMTRYAKLLNVIFDVEIPGEDDEIVMNCNEILEKFFASQEDKAA